MCSTCGDHDHGASGARVVHIEAAKARVLEANERIAQGLRADLSARGCLMLNITSAPGSGKTALLARTLPLLPQGSAAVLVGDLETDRDAARLRGLGHQILQINTGKGCHLSALQVARGLDQLDLSRVKTLFVENVGNMACPSGYDLGEHLRVAMLSLPEGDDKAAKYPGLFAAADVVLLSKVDLGRVLPFDEALFRDDLSRLKASVPVIKVSAQDGSGIRDWMEWMEQCRSRALGRPALPNQA